VHNPQHAIRAYHQIVGLHQLPHAGRVDAPNAGQVENNDPLATTT
jgi:hypothetical protein